MLLRSDVGNVEFFLLANNTPLELLCVDLSSCFLRLPSPLAVNLGGRLLVYELAINLPDTYEKFSAY